MLFDYLVNKQTADFFFGRRELYEFAAGNEMKMVQTPEPASRSKERRSAVTDLGESPAPRILLVDDDDKFRCLLGGYLTEAGYCVEEVDSARPALERIQADTPDLVVLDLLLPDCSGHEVLEEIRSDPTMRLLPVVILTGFPSGEEKLRSLREGATDFLTKPFSPAELLSRVRALLMLKRFADEHDHAEHVVLTLAKVIDARDPYTAGHSGRVADYADEIGLRMGLDSLTRNDMRQGALLHDLGKIAIPDAVLRKRAPLTRADRMMLEKHPEIGRDLLSPIRALRRIFPIVYCHHERLNGTGYPEGIAGTDIPLTVRIVTVADVFDELTRARDAIAASEAPSDFVAIRQGFESLQEGVQNGWWDPDVVEALRATISERGATA